MSKTHKKPENFIHKFLSTSKVFKVSFYAVSIGIFALISTLGYLLYQTNTQINKSAQAAPVCPAGFSPGANNTCRAPKQTVTSGYTCPQGGSVSGTNCVYEDGIYISDCSTVNADGNIGVACYDQNDDDNANMNGGLCAKFDIDLTANGIPQTGDVANGSAQTIKRIYNDFPNKNGIGPVVNLPFYASNYKGKNVCLGIPVLIGSGTFKKCTQTVYNESSNDYSCSQYDPTLKTYSNADCSSFNRYPITNTYIGANFPEDYNGDTSLNSTNINAYDIVNKCERLDEIRTYGQGTGRTGPDNYKDAFMVRKTSSGGSSYAATGTTTQSCPPGGQDAGPDCTISPSSYTPEGNFDVINQSGQAQGWAIDRDALTANTDVHFYIDGPAGSGGNQIGQTTTSTTRDDINTTYSTTGTHGFNFQIPSQYCNSTDRALYAYAIDPQGVSNTLLDGSPKTFNLSPAQCGAVTSTTIGLSNIGNSVDCTTSLTVVIPASYNCTFPLRTTDGSTNNDFTPPANPLNAHTATDATGTTPLSNSKSNDCTIKSNKTPQVSLECTNIKTTGSTSGVKNVLVTLNNANPTDKGDVTLTNSATTITGPNIKPGTCNPSSVTVGSTTSTCTYPLTGDSGNNYTYPTGGITANTPAGASSACTISGGGTSAVSLVCTNVKAGTTPDTITVTPTGTGITNPGTATLTVTSGATVIGLSNIGNSVDCTTSLTVVIPASYNCTFPLRTTDGSTNNDFTPPANPLNAHTATDATGTTPLSNSKSNDCTIKSNKTPQVSLECTNIKTTGSTSGVKNVLVTLNNANPTDKGDVTLTNSATTITGPNIKPGTCNPSSVTVGSTTSTCTYPLTGDSGNNYTYPTGGITANTPAGASSACTISGGGTSAVSLVCTNVKAGTTPDTITVTPTGTGITNPGTATLTVTSGATVIGLSNIGNSVDCTTSLTVVIPASYNCTFPLTGSTNNSYILPSNPLNAHTATDATGTTPLSNSKSNDCTIVSASSTNTTTNQVTTTSSLQCNNIKTVGAVKGFKNVLMTLNNLTPTDKGDVDLTASLTATDIPGLNVVCNNGQPVYINSTTTCVFTLPDHTTLPPDTKLGIGDALPGGNCSVATNSKTVTCTNVPTGSQVGQQSIYVQLGNDTKTDSGKKATVLALQVVRTGGDLITGILILSTLGIGSALVYYYTRKRGMRVEVR